MPYLVDGNNLAHALGLSHGGLADRESCASMVGTFCRLQGAQATIVFDGPAPPGSAAVRNGSRVRVIFSEGRSADEILLRFLTASRTPRDFTLVTSDKSLGDKGRHRGATLERAHEFAQRLRRHSTSGSAPSEKPGRPETPDEIEAWLAIFDPGRH
jgi:uncharacterized protein